MTTHCACLWKTSAFSSLRMTASWPSPTPTRWLPSAPWSSAPVPSAAAALEAVATADLDVAILDVKLRDGMAYPVSDALDVFQTGLAPLHHCPAGHAACRSG